MVDRFITGLCKCGNVAGLEKCAAASLIAKSPQVLSEYLAAASESGLVEVLDWWFRELDQFSTLMTTWTWTTCLHECVRMACRSGRVHAVDWWAKYLQSQGRDLDRIIDRLSPCWLEMFSLGHVELLTHVHLTLRCEVAVNENEDGFHDDVCFMDVASAMGQTASLDWIMTYAIAPHYTTEAMDRASAAGYVHVLDWWARCGMPLKFTPAAKTDAAKAGQQAVVEWWNTFPLYRILLCGPLLPNNPTTAAHTTDEVTLASFGCLDWMRKLAKCEDGFITIYKARAFCQAIARFGHVHIMREYGMVLDCRDDLHDESIVTAAKFNQLAMWRYLVKVMYDLYEEEDPNLSDLWLQCTLAAAEHDSVDVFDMLLINLKTRPSPCSFPDVVLGACKGGAVRILQYLIDNRHWKPSLISAAQQQGALQAAIAGGHVHVLDWWHRTAAERSLAPDVKSSESWLDSLVALACVHGHANVLEWIGNTFGWSALTISSADVRAVGINKSKKVIAWLMAAHAKSNIKLSPASVKYLELASQSQ
ncbi:hypothetical protein BCR44DRAFT_1428553 [Catenaria anguillulae PL171]|uniref:Ankyrin repeat-containing domain protein n=1 Tax=Catenaria anguillulae PL171 TaxID=765915 RepID=A0A1Y2HXW5_9FUNG|nr:hypothetical protein BCR44DRAFT_1428553 [Catenaria anguillulae PL171]